METYKCLQCHKNVFNSLNMKYHMQICLGNQLFCCPMCEQYFESHYLYNRHILYCGKIICDICNLPFINSKAFKYHREQNHSKTDSSLVLNIYCCRLCDFKCTYKGDLYVHRLNQHGRGDLDLKSPPWDTDPFDNEDIRQVYNTNKSHILSKDVKGELKSTYNYPTDNLKGGYDEIQEHIEDIYSQQSNAFKINFSFGLILYNSENESFRYFIPFHNSRVMDFPRMISSRRSITLLMNILKKIDIIAVARADRPSSAWSLAYITNINYYVYTMLSYWKNFKSSSTFS